MSASVSMIRLIDDVRTECSGVLDGALRRILFNILREFFRRSNIWLFEMPIYIIPTTNDYVLNTCQHADVVRLMILGKPERALSIPIEYVPGSPPQFLKFDIASNETQIPYYRIPRDGGLLNAGVRCPILRIGWNPGSNDTWIATLSMSVADPVDADGLPSGMPDWIIEKYFDYISCGVIGKLMLQANKPYSNPKLAEYHMRKFHEGVGLARTENRHMFNYSGQRWVFPQTWAGPFHHRAV